MPSLTDSIRTTYKLLCYQPCRLPPRFAVSLRPSFSVLYYSTIKPRQILPAPKPSVGDRRLSCSLRSPPPGTMLSRRIDCYFSSLPSYSTGHSFVALYSIFSSNLTRSRISLFEVSSISPASMNSSRMLYTLLKLNTMSSSHTLLK